MRRASSLAVLTLAAGAAAAQESADRRGEVQEQALVERVVVDAHVLGPDGNPIAGLGPEDFLVSIDGEPVTLEAVDWLPADRPEADASMLERLRESDAAPGMDDLPAGRLIVMLFQHDWEITRMFGLLRMGIQARRFLDTLLPTDRVAVASFDSRLKLRQDFTADRKKIERAIHDSLRRGEPEDADEESHPSLARRLDPRAARRCATPERALELLAAALAPIPGGKSMLYFGWGLGTMGGLSGATASEQKSWTEALRRMAEARVNVFTLDIADADYHSLEGYLEQMSDLTGGRYEKTHLFPSLAMNRVRRAISGRYVLVLVKPKGPRGEHAIDVAVVGHKGVRVYARRYYMD